MLLDIEWYRSECMYENDRKFICFYTSHESASVRWLADRSCICDPVPPRFTAAVPYCHVNYESNTITHIHEHTRTHMYTDTHTNNTVQPSTAKFTHINIFYDAGHKWHTSYVRACVCSRRWSHRLTLHYVRSTKHRVGASSCTLQPHSGMFITRRQFCANIAPHTHTQAHKIMQLNSSDAGSDAYVIISCYWRPFAYIMVKVCACSECVQFDFIIPSAGECKYMPYLAGP